MDGLDFNSLGTLYGFAQTTGDLYTINTSNGATTLVGISGTEPDGLAGLTFDSMDNLFAITRDGLLHSMDANNADATLIGDTGLSEVSGLSALNGVPEPGTLVLLGMSLAAVGAASRRRRARA